MTDEVRVREYKDAAEFNRDAQYMTKQGWTIAQQSQGSTHMNVGRTIFTTAATLGINMLVPKGGASYSKGKITVTWTRTLPEGNSDISSYAAHGWNGQIAVWRDRVVLKKKKELSFPLSDIVGIEFVEAQPISGYIRLLFSGDTPIGDLQLAKNDPHTAVFTGKQEDGMRTVAQKIDEWRSPPDSPEDLRAPAPTAVSDDPIAQLERLAKLRDTGVLTEEEFAQQKARVLGT
jgi:hypothetical protein